MSRRYTYATLVILILIFLVGIFDTYIDPIHDFIPEAFPKIAATILAGVAIGTILAGLKRNGSGDIFITREPGRDSDDHTDSQHHDV